MISNSRSTTQHTAVNAAVNAEVLPPRRVADTYSDSLMDDLFLDVDSILEGDLSSYMTLISHQPKPIASSARTVQLPSHFAPQSAADIYRATVAARQFTDPVTLPKALPPSSYRATGRPVTTSHSTPQSASYNSHECSPSGYDLHGSSAASERSPDSTGLATQGLYAYSPASDMTLAKISPRPPQTVFEPKSQQSVSLPFLLIGAAGISAIRTLGLWILSQTAHSTAWLPISREAAAAEIPSQSDQDFLAYLQQSLKVISSREDAKIAQMTAVLPIAQTATLPTTVPNVNGAPQLGALPNLPGAAATGASANSPANVIERVFVPVYQNSAQTSVQPNIPLPAVALPNLTRRLTVRVPAPVAAAAAIPPRAPAAATASLPIVPSGGGRALSPSPQIAVGNTNQAATALTDVTPNSAHALVGILNLGSRSAALIDIDGSSQRAYVGDRIGVSGWTLVSVNGQDVVVRRNGEVRSIYIGQRF
ncbi:MAG: hypothetical protein DCF15_10590 [Phormidesmis priestleyi]|uniref:Type II secretion system protein GspC N-terminal domain-containing protein n=1 Tax=Phormidesmis priestleyi TaxID=268141 RepID=A0A2W4XLZ1_9CYAN|nr:MAG: hypothetical protein DCF15_10590 [Phormidesmis priestleyi]